MCTPPFCYPARRALGCLTLRQASASVITLNSIYGFTLVMVHVLVFRARSRSRHDGRLLESQSTRHGDNWYLQVLDLDLAWAHGTFGVRDWWLCMCGMFYGIIIIVFSLFMLHAVLAVSHATIQSTAMFCRWFMVFLHFELILYIAIVLLKFLALCHLKKHFFTLMDEDCSILKYTFAERACFRFLLASWCCWIFSSFAYFVAWGDPIVDDALLPDTTAGSLPVSQPSLSHSSAMQMPHRGFFQQQHMNDRAYVQQVFVNNSV